MKIRRTAAAIAAATAGALMLSACATPEVAGVEGSEAQTVTVSWNQPMFSQNNLTAAGNATANANILYLTQSRFFFYDDALELVMNEDFGTIETISEEPLTVQVTINEGVTWSDGTAVDAADLILMWGAQNPRFNTTEQEYDDEGNPLPIADDQVFFSGTGPIMELVSQFPEISEDGRSITMEFDSVRSDWLMGIEMTPVAAHAVADLALDIPDAQEAKDALVAAFRDNDTAALSKISDTWNNAFNFTSMPDDERLFLSNGPFILSEYVENQHLTLVRNEDFDWGHVPNVDEVTFRFTEDPLAAITALQNGEVDLVSPQSSVDVLQTLAGIDGIEYTTGVEATWEHLTLMHDNGGPFDAATYGGDAEVARLVRQAFLLTVPRQQIIDTLVAPLQEDATVRNSFVFVPGAPGYDDATAANGSDFFGGGDPAKAAELLDQARALYPALPETIDVRILYGASNVRRANQFQLIQAAAAPVGFNVVDGGDDNWGSLVFSGGGTFDAALFGWQSTSTMLLNGEANYVTDGQNNFSGFSNPEVDALWDKIAVAADDTTDEVRAWAVEMESHLFADGFGLPLFQHPGVVAHTARLQNASTITLSPTVLWNFWEWETTGR